MGEQQDLWVREAIKKEKYGNVIIAFGRWVDRAEAAEQRVAELEGEFCTCKVEIDQQLRDEFVRMREALEEGLTLFAEGEDLTWGEYDEWCKKARAALPPKPDAPGDK